MPVRTKLRATAARTYSCPARVVRDADTLFRAQWSHLRNHVTGRLGVDLAAIMEYADTLLGYEAEARGVPEPADSRADSAAITSS